MKKNLPGICFFGCGYITDKHAKILRKLYPAIELSFASNEAAGPREYVKRFKGMHHYDNYEDAAAADTFDIAHIATPHAYHADLAVLAANNKKHIIIEKPVTRNLKELQSIEKAVARNNVRCTVAENYFFKPSIPTIRKYITEGYIGKPLFIELNKTNRDTISGWRTDEELMGGGALLEGGVHWVNALVSLAGSNPTGVIAFKPDIDYTTNVPFEDTLLVTVQFDNGVIGKLLHSWRIPNLFKGAGISRIFGTEGVITFESNGLFCFVWGKKKRISFPKPLDFLGFKAMYQSFIETYCDGKPWEPSLDRIKMELKLVEAAYKSLNTKKLERL